MTFREFPQGIVDEWGRFMTTEYTRPPGHDLYPAIFDSGILFPLQRQNELAAMIAMARTVNPSVVMEIGSDKGGGFYHWVKGLEVKTAIAVEYRGVPFEDAFRRNFPSVDFKFVDGSSYARETVADIKKFLGFHLIDCLFIDGDKGGTKKDFEAYLPLMRPGGLVFIHDINAKGHPPDFFYSLKKDFRITAIIDGREGSIAEKREKDGLPVRDSYEQWMRIWKWDSCGVGVVHV